MASINHVLVIAVEESVLDRPLRQRRTVLVRDLFEREPMWKFPGGSTKPNEAALEAALREFSEETGGGVVYLSEENLIREIPRWTHTSCLFLGEADFDTIGPYGDENGKRLEVKVTYTIGQILRGEVEILPLHLKWLRSIPYI